MVDSLCRLRRRQIRPRAWRAEPDRDTNPQRNLTTGVKVTMPTTKPASGVNSAFTPATPTQISAEKQRRIAELAANGMTLAEAKAALEQGNLSDDSLEGVTGGFPPLSHPLLH